MSKIMRFAPHRLSLALMSFAGAACGPVNTPADTDTATDAASSSPGVTGSSTGVPPESTASGNDPSTGSDPSTTTSSGTSASSGNADAGCVDLEGQACSVWGQDCPEGQKCVPYALRGVRGILLDYGNLQFSCCRIAIAGFRASTSAF